MYQVLSPSVVNSLILVLCRVPCASVIKRPFHSTKPLTWSSETLILPSNCLLVVVIHLLYSNPGLVTSAKKDLRRSGSRRNKRGMCRRLREDKARVPRKLARECA
ncbi:hypothetical protein F5Y10DRAFT_246499 [Nemania abortiva]|nr:hypothetical protein F5Y10DRAFT_246499 [Nemania abortiva]